MIKLKKLGHIQLRVADLERSKAFYRDVLGFRVAEQDPKHGDLFMTLGEDFHTLDMTPHESPESARGPARPLGVAHIAFQVANYEALREAYRTLLQHGVRIERAMDHVNQRSIYFADPDGNRLEIYFEMPGALARFPDGRGDQNRELTVSNAGEPLPAWLSEQWPGSSTAAGNSSTPSSKES
jgi:catechol 2,3-dioxygenase-like lactoylglutathione lyase family enzyme